MTAAAPRPPKSNVQEVNILKRKLTAEQMSDFFLIILLHSFDPY